MSADDVAARRVRLAELETMLAKLRAQYDVSMNAFKFDEARRLVARIEAAEGDRVALEATLPPLLPPAPILLRRRPIRRRRR